MHIVSLLPSATEIIYRLELQDQLVGVTHECDFPPEARSKPVLIESRIDPHGLSSAQIDAAVRELVQKGESVYRFKPGVLEQAKPDLIITQGLCEVCAIASHYVVAAAKTLRPEPQLLSLDPQDLTGILTDIRRVGESTGAVDKAGEVVDALEERVGEVAGRAREIPDSKRRRVAVIEWTDPIYSAGHWVPEMIELAGGRDVLAKAGEPSTAIKWEQVVAAAPEILIVAPCGCCVTRAKKEIESLKQRPGWSQIPAVKAGRIYAMDANATLSRPGPRIVDGLEQLAQIIQPDLFEVSSAGARWEVAK
jgi:iron complex transport system substrate-binding protein